MKKRSFIDTEATIFFEREYVLCLKSKNTNLTLDIDSFSNGRGYL